jgi:hypothetical protein
MSGEGRTKNQEYIDELLASLRLDPDSFVSGDEAVRRFEGLVELAVEWAKIVEAVSYDFIPKHAQVLEDYGVEADRVAELASGAEPTEEETEFWHQEWESRNDFVEVVTVYKLSGSDSSTAFFTLSEEGAYGTLLDGSGPYFHTESLANKLVEKVLEWDAWWVASGEAGSESFIELVEQRSGKAEQGGA